MNYLFKKYLRIFINNLSAPLLEFLFYILVNFGFFDFALVSYWGPETKALIFLVIIQILIVIVSTLISSIYSKGFTLTNINQILYYSLSSISIFVLYFFVISQLYIQLSLLLILFIVLVIIIFITIRLKDNFLNIIK